MKATNIIWDVDSEEELALLPNEIEIPVEMIYMEEVSDYISEKTGFCHKGFEPDFNGMSIRCPYCGEEITIEYDTARCEECGWMCADCELDDIMLS